jgi:hypothetical protein
MSQLPVNANEYENDIDEFWKQIECYWYRLYEFIKQGDAQRQRAIELVNGLLTEKLFLKIQIDFTYGMINKVPLDSTKELVEFYISPRLSKDNVPIMELLYNKRINLPNVHFIKYRAYHHRDALVRTVEGKDKDKEIVINYTDIGCQTSATTDAETKLPLLNLVLYIKEPAASKILEKKKLKYIENNEEKEIEKWLPNDTAVIDIILLNIIGEYNFINYIGYIEFIPENDPIITPGSVFLDLETIRGELEILFKVRSIDEDVCQTCNRRKIQSDIYKCTRCKKTYYCSKVCQAADYSQHKRFCKSNEKSKCKVPV